ncbi:MAG: VOC family protein [Patescibacteria group bacterium]
MTIHHIAISVDNLEHSLDFYRTNFGFAEISRFERQDLGGKAVFMKLGEILLEIWEFTERRNMNNLADLNVVGIRHIAFEVVNLNSKIEEFQNAGIEVSKPDKGASGGIYAFLKDPDGIPIELYEPKKNN